MQSSDLAKEQARALKNKLHGIVGYLARLKKRMHYRGFPSDDPLLDAVGRAEDAVHRLHVAVHHLCVGEITGRR